MKFRFQHTPRAKVKSPCERLAQSRVRPSCQRAVIRYPLHSAGKPARSLASRTCARSSHNSPLSDQIRAAIAELRAELDEQLEESLRVLLELAAGSDGETDDLRAAFQEIDTATSESEVLCRLLEQCSTKAERVGLLLLKNDVFEGWAGIGFDQSTFGDLRVEVEDVAATALQAAHNVAASTKLE